MLAARDGIDERENELFEREREATVAGFPLENETQSNVNYSDQYAARRNTISAWPK